MPSRSRPPKPPKPTARAGRKAAGSADAPRTPRSRAAPPASPTRASRVAKPRATAEPTGIGRRAPASPAPAASRAAATGGAGAGPAAPRRPTLAVRRTCYEVRLLVCPRNPSTCPETWPVEGRVLCGSPEMLARFEKAGGAEDLDAEAGYADVLPDLTIRNRPDEDLEERDRGDDDEGAEGEE